MERDEEREREIWKERMKHTDNNRVRDAKRQSVECIMTFTSSSQMKASYFFKYNFLGKNREQYGGFFSKTSEFTLYSCQKCSVPMFLNWIFCNIKKAPCVLLCYINVTQNICIQI